MTTPHLCGEPGCPEIIDGPGRCTTHHHAGAPGTPGYGRAWQRVRDAYYATHPRCQQCGAPGKDVHHCDGRHPREPGANAPTNLMTLCRSCHRRETEHARRRARARHGVGGPRVAIEPGGLANTASGPETRGRPGAS